MLQTCIRATIHNTTAFANAILQYATLGLTSEVRLAITRRYVQGETEPEGCCLIENSPVLYAVAKVGLPSVPGDLFVVLDYPGLTMQRRPRELEVRSLIESLIQQGVSNVKYATQPIEATNAMTPEEAVRTIFAADYTDLTQTTEADFLARLR